MGKVSRSQLGDEDEAGGKEGRGCSGPRTS